MTWMSGRPAECCAAHARSPGATRPSAGPKHAAIEAFMTTGLWGGLTVLSYAVVVLASCSSNLGVPGPGGSAGSGGEGQTATGGQSGHGPQGGAGTGGMAGSGGGVSREFGSPCRDSGACPYPLTCLAPGHVSAGGTSGSSCGACIAPASPCTMNSDCKPYNSAGPRGVCVVDTSPCACPNAMICVPDCTDPGFCPVGTRCGADYRCDPVGCAAGGTDACPLDFTCGTDSKCARSRCTEDTQCSGACVNGACYDRPGTCGYPSI